MKTIDLKGSTFVYNEDLEIYVSMSFQHVWELGEFEANEWHHAVINGEVEKIKIEEVYNDFNNNYSDFVSKSVNADFESDFHGYTV